MKDTNQTLGLRLILVLCVVKHGILPNSQKRCIKVHHIECMGIYLFIPRKYNNAYFQLRSDMAKPVFIQTNIPYGTSGALR